MIINMETTSKVHGKEYGEFADDLDQLLQRAAAWEQVAERHNWDESKPFCANAVRCMSALLREYDRVKALALGRHTQIEIDDTHDSLIAQTRGM